MRYKLIFSIIFFIFTLHGFSQNKIIEDSLLEQLNNVEGKDRISVLIDLGEVLIRSEPGKASKVASEALELSKDLNYQKGIAISQYMFGNIALYSGMYNEAKPRYDTALAIFKKINNREYISAVINSYGIIYDDQGDFENALKYYLESYNISEEIEHYKGMADATNNIGMIYVHQRKNDYALDYFNKSLVAHEKINDKRGMGNNLNNSGLIYMHKGDFDKAEEYFNKAIEIWNEIKDNRGMAMTLNCFGSLKIKQEDYSSAENYINRSYAICEKKDDYYGMTQNLYSLSVLYMNMGKYKKAIETNMKSLEIAKITGAITLMISNYNSLYKIYYKIRDFEKALDYHVLYMQMKDSIYDKESNKKIIEMQEKHEAEKKEKEIELLNKDNELKATQIAKKDEEAKKQKIIIFSIIGILALSIAFAFVLFNRFQVIRGQKNIIEEQKKIVDDKNRDITESIQYAMNIQQAALLPMKQVKEILPDSFILFKPKDIVSGDFYWISKVGHHILFSAIDCTGHGVPGAFMSLIGNDLLNIIVNEKHITNSGKVLDELDKRLQEAINPSLRSPTPTQPKEDLEGDKIKHGMDLAFCSLDTKNNILHYAGAYNPLYIVHPSPDPFPKERGDHPHKASIASGKAGAVPKGSFPEYSGLRSTQDDNELIEIRADKQPVGFHYKDKVPFTNHEIQLKKGDIVYIFSDGYRDQFGGENGKKFMKKRFKQLFIDINDKSMDEQREILDKTIEDWKGNREQVDDILIIGVKV